MSPEQENGNATEGYLGKRKRRGMADERAVRAVHMRSAESKTWKQIGDELGITPPAAQSAYNRGVLLLVPKNDIDHYRELALQKLDLWEQLALDLYNKEYALVNFGKIVMDANGDPMEDFAPKVQVIDRLIKIERERRAIVGYSAPSKRVLEVVGEDAFDRAIRELNEDAARLERETQLQDELRAAIGPAPTSD